MSTLPQSYLSWGEFCRQAEALLPPIQLLIKPNGRDGLLVLAGAPGADSVRGGGVHM